MHRFNRRKPSPRGTSVSVSYSSKAALALVEASYDIHADADDWFPRLLEPTRLLLDDGLGVMGAIGVMPPPPALPQVAALAGDTELAILQANAIREFPPQTIHDETRTGMLVISERNRDRPDHLEVWRRHLGEAASDGVMVTAVDPDRRGIHFFAPKREVTRVSPGERAQWEMLAAHLSSGLRLRGRLSSLEHGVEGTGAELPCGAEAVIETKSFRVTDQAGSGRGSGRAQVLREAAARMDRARGSMRDDDSEEALLTWEALIRGRWSLVDWFDTDDRRYVLAVPNPPGVSDPRGLTERESQVVAYAALGESHKLIGYRLGISRARVANHLRSAMRKLGVKTAAQFVTKMHALARAFPPP